jgi:hypothetical protein
MAEFFRLSLLAGLCEPSTVARWADSIVAAEPSPHIAFIELCIAGSQSASSVQTLLDDVPGHATPDFSVQMLLGHASRLVTAHVFTPEQLLLRLYHMASLETFPDSIYYELSAFEDELSLARDGVYGTVSEVAQDFTTFLATYDSYAPNTSTGNA